MSAEQLWSRKGPCLAIPLACYRIGLEAPANQTKERSVHELFTGAFWNKNSM